MSLKRKVLMLIMAFFVVVVFVPISLSPVHAGGRFTKKIDDAIDGASNAGATRRGVSGVPAPPGSRAPSPPRSPSSRVPAPSSSQPSSSSVGASYNSSAASPSSRVPASSSSQPGSSGVGASYSSTASSGGTSGKRKRDETDLSKTERDYSGRYESRDRSDSYDNPGGQQGGGQYYKNHISDNTIDYILYGKGKGGGHMVGYGDASKTKFPADWSEKKIIHNISDIAEDSSLRETYASGNKVIKEGYRDGTIIRVILTEDGSIISAYPLARSR